MALDSTCTDANVNLAQYDGGEVSDGTVGISDFDESEFGESVMAGGDVGIYHGGDNHHEEEYYEDEHEYEDEEEEMEGGAGTRKSKISKIKKDYIVHKAIDIVVGTGNRVTLELEDKLREMTGGSAPVAPESSSDETKPIKTGSIVFDGESASQPKNPLFTRHGETMDTIFLKYMMDFEISKIQNYIINLMI